MNKFLLDTSVIIDCLRGIKHRPQQLENLCVQGHMLGCCCVNIAEIYAGVKPGEEKVTQKLINSLEYFEITREIAQKAGKLKHFYQKRGITLHLADTLIAATALSQDLILITDNAKHFPMPEIKKADLGQ